jgi:hypothetical protein
MSPQRVTDLVAEYRQHHVSGCDPCRCTCGDLWQCAAKRDVWRELFDAGEAVALWVVR